MKLPKLPLKIMAFVLVGFIAAAGGAFGAITAAGGLMGVNAKAGEPPETHVETKRVGIMYPTRDRIVNLADAGVLRYLKTSVVLEIYDPEKPQGAAGDAAAAKGKPELPKDLVAKSVSMEDKITEVLSAKSAAEILTPDGRTGLKQELKSELNDLLGQDRVLAVYFTDFIVQ